MGRRSSGKKALLKPHEETSQSSLPVFVQEVDDAVHCTACHSGKLLGSCGKLVKARVSSKVKYLS